jgi:hypothetical protein
VGGGGHWQAEAVGTRACSQAGAGPAQNGAMQGQGAHLDVKTAGIIKTEMELRRPPMRAAAAPTEAWGGGRHRRHSDQHTGGAVADPAHPTIKHHMRHQVSQEVNAAMAGPWQGRQLGKAWSSPCERTNAA